VLGDGREGRNEVELGRGGEGGNGILWDSIKMRIGTLQLRLLPSLSLGFAERWIEEEC
jgi:hypothetical protein